MNHILIADGEILFREGLRLVIDSWDDFVVLGEAGNGLEAVQKTTLLMPDIVLIDVAMPVLNGIEAIRQIKHQFPSIRIVVLTASEDDEDLFQSLKAGVSGYILKRICPKRLHDMLRGVMRNETPISGIMVTKVVEALNNPKEEPPCNLSKEAFTAQEQAVMELLVEGLTNIEIAERLYLSESTIKKRLHAVLEKLKLDNRVEVAAFAIKEGLVKSPAEKNLVD